MTMSAQSERNAGHGDCDHAWERRADLDATLILRFSCSKCGVLGYRRFGYRAIVRPYPDGRTQMPEFHVGSEETSMSRRRLFFSNPSAVQEWRERKAWKEMLTRGDA
jgi:hypothetical protein